MRTLAGLFTFLGLAAITEGAIVTKWVEYEQGGASLRGYLAYDNSRAGARPLVLVFHDWDGINDYEMLRSKALAKMGYVAFAADIFGKGAKVDTVAERSALVQEFYNNLDLFRARAEAGLSEALKQPNVDAKRVAAIGYCFGGGTALELARDGANLLGVVSFHGTLQTKRPMVKNAFRGKVLVLAGGADPFVPKQHIESLKQEMKNAGVPVRVVSYPGAMHAFTIKGSEKMGLKGVAYNAKADKGSWEEMKKFFERVLR